MAHVADVTERYRVERATSEEAAPTPRVKTNLPAGPLARGAMRIVHDVGAKLVVIWTQTRRTARVFSQHHFPVPILALANDHRSLRRLAPCAVEVRTLEHGIHSGMYGGPAPDALTTLCRLLATLPDQDGHVPIAGLPVCPTEPLAMTDARFRPEAAVLPPVPLVPPFPTSCRPLHSRPYSELPAPP